MKKKDPSCCLPIFLLLLVLVGGFLLVLGAGWQLDEIELDFLSDLIPMAATPTPAPLPQPLSEKVSEEAAFPFWIDNASLGYFHSASGEFRAHPSGAVLAGPLYGIVQHIVVAPDGKTALVSLLQDLYPDLLYVNLTSGAVEVIASGECPAAWVSPQEFAALCNVPPGWAAADGGARLWQGPSGLPLHQMADFSRSLPADWMAFSANSRYLGVHSGAHFYLWQIDSAGAQYLNDLWPVKYAAWDPLEPDRLVTTDELDTALVVRAGVTSKVEFKFPTASGALAFLPNSRLLFTAYNPAEGGSLLSAYDLDSQSQLLLLDPGLMRGRAAELAASPDGKSIAYTTEFGLLYRAALGR